MTTVEVETRNAKYILLFGQHFLSSSYTNKSFDAVIIEGVRKEGPVLSKRPSSLDHPQFQDLVSKAAKEGKQIWITDPPIKKTSRISHEIRIMTLGILSLPYWLLDPLIDIYYDIYSEKGKKPPVEWPRKAKTKINEIIGGKIVTILRNVVNTEKADSFLAPRLRKEIQRKPVIAMAFGSGHFGIKYLLENPRKRRKILMRSRISKLLPKGYQSSLRIHLDQKRKFQRVEEFPNTMRVESRLKKIKKRRRLLPKLFKIRRGNIKK